MHVCIHICAMHTYMQQAPERAPLHIQEPPTVRILAGVGARRWTQITSRLLAVPGTRPPAISTRKRSVRFREPCSTPFLVVVLILAKRARPLLRLLPSPLCLFNKLERNDENRANFQATAESNYSSGEMEDSCCPLDSSFLIGFLGCLACRKGSEGCTRDAERVNKFDAILE